MDTRNKLIIGTALVLGGLGVGTGIAVAGSGNVAPTTPSPTLPFVDDDRDDREPPITASELEHASAAALAHTGGGIVTDAERDDDGGPVRYEVEVRMDDGTEVDLDLDETFAVLTAEVDD